ncbi:MAG: sodium:proton antiporter, partial [Beijerinckiaceae bacterium]
MIFGGTMKRSTVFSGMIAAGLLAATPALSATLDGKALGVWWSLPFIGMLLCIAIFPLVNPHFWEHHQGKIAALCAALVALPMLLTQGAGVTFDALMHTLLLEYIPFILLLVALFTTAGGILIAGNIHGSPATNTLMLFIGTVLASFIGTTGASMVMVRPMLRANDNRKHNVHIFVFFIFLVSNIGGSLTPLGDPPLFLGFLRGVDFFWTLQNILPETLLAGTIVLGIFYLMDRYFYAKEDELLPRDPTPDKKIRIRGLVNVALIGVIIAAILFSASVNLGTFKLLGQTVETSNVIRDVVFVLVTLASLKLTDSHYREANGFNWGPMKEVAKLFAGIFITIVPVLAMLKAGKDGAVAPLVALVSNTDGTPNNAAYFWMTGILSSFLDN